MGGMKVGVIAAEMEGRRTGVGRYLEGMLRGLECWDHGGEWHLFFQGDPFNPPAAEGGPAIPHFSGHRGSRVLWEQVVVTRELAHYDLDVLFGPAYALPFSCPLPSVVAMHDLSFEVLPLEFRPRERWRRRLLARRAARMADRVLTDTAAMAGLVSERYAVPPDRLAVVPLGVDVERFSPLPAVDDDRVLSELGVQGAYLLWLGAVFERRLPREVLEAVAVLRRDRPELELVMVGGNRMRRPGLLQRWIEELGLGDSVVLHDWVGEDGLAPLYRGAELSFYLSLHEGFGIPPLESLACGTPVVVSSGLALDEIWPAYPYRCREATARAIVATAREILEDGERSVQVMKEASDIIAELDWETSSRRLVAELEKVLR
jgi:glycosyltransferase involved in cell wall biosynthesis